MSKTLFGERFIFTNRSNSNIVLSAGQGETLVLEGSGTAIGLDDGKIFVGDVTDVAVGTTVSGDATLSNTGVLTLANTGITATTYTTPFKMTVDVKGRVVTIPRYVLASTYATYGDSFTVGVGSETTTSWPAMLATLSGKTAVNNGVSSTTIVDLTNTQPQRMQNVVSNATYNDYSFIVAYGFNDLRNTLGLYTEPNVYQWYQVYLNVIATMAIKQANIYGARTGWSGLGWTNTDVNNYGKYTATNGASLTRDITGRYYLFSFLILNVSTAAAWTITIGGVVVASPKFVHREGSSGVYYNFCAIVDMQTSASRTVVVTNSIGNTTNQYFDYCAAWDSNSTFRNVLCCSIPMFDFAYTGGSPWTAGTMARYTMFNDLIKQAVITCQNLGLPVYHYQDSNINCFDSDGVHWSNGGYFQRASGIYNISQS